MIVKINSVQQLNAQLSQIWNPAALQNDPNFERRSEDSIIAWTWRTFTDSPEPSDPTVILRMPMTKASPDTYRHLTYDASEIFLEGYNCKFIQKP